MHMRVLIPCTTLTLGNKFLTKTRVRTSALRIRLCPCPNAATVSQNPYVYMEKTRTRGIRDYITSKRLTHTRSLAAMHFLFVSENLHYMRHILRIDKSKRQEKNLFAQQKTHNNITQHVVSPLISSCYEEFSSYF